MVAVSAPASAHAATAMRAGGAMQKLGRGVVNVFSGWVEIPQRITETSHDQGTAAGLTWGLLRGLGYGLVRTAAGFYEVITFPFPAPPNYKPVIEPEFVFGDH
jgi:putative exosortase-associated protein (TIGR04073 family)